MKRSFLFSFCVFLASSLWQTCKAEELTQDDVAFEESVIRAIDAHDALWMAQHVGYPIIVHIDGKDIWIKSQDKFIKNYDKIINENVVSAVKKYGNTSAFKNYQGFMIGRGAIWMWGETEGVSLKTIQFRQSTLAGMVRRKCASRQRERSRLNNAKIAVWLR